MSDTRASHDGLLLCTAIPNQTAMMLYYKICIQYMNIVVQRFYATISFAQPRPGIVSTERDDAIEKYQVPGILLNGDEVFNVIADDDPGVGFFLFFSVYHRAAARILYGYPI